jgi:hypothetical protein
MAAVKVAAREVIDEIFNSANADLLQRLGSNRSDSCEELDASSQSSFRCRSWLCLFSRRYGHGRSV